MGSLVGAFTSFVTTYANQRNQYRRDFIAKQFAQREALYSEFLNEAARLQVESLDSQMEKASRLVNSGCKAHHRKNCGIVQAPQYDSRGDSQGGLLGHGGPLERVW